MKLTSVFPPHITPVHEGVYKVDSQMHSYPHVYAYWDGKQWMGDRFFLDDAPSVSMKSSNQQRKWCGVVKKNSHAQLIDWLRYEAEWWWSPSVLECLDGAPGATIREANQDWGWCALPDNEVEIWFSLLIAEALETE